MNVAESTATTIPTADELFKVRYEKECLRVNKFMSYLMIAQWFAGLAFATCYSPFTWIGQHNTVHIHVWAAVLLGGAISGFALTWLILYPRSEFTRHVVAITQMLWSALLIHLSGGRIETHFHVFASLAILSIYRDWKILITATVVVAIDHFVRGVFYPLSAFGILTESPYRWIEHAAWVLFEVAFLAPGCRRLKHEIHELCSRQTELLEAKRTVDIQVGNRTKDLVEANHLLAEKTEEAEKLALVARYTDNSVMITDAQFDIEWTNEGFARLTGYDNSEVIGSCPLSFQMTERTQGDVAGRIREAIQTGRGFNGELASSRKDGKTFWMAMEIRPIHNAKQKVDRFIVIQSDITDRVDAETENAKLHSELIDASRQAGMAEMATGVLHNVGNVLNSVNVSASLIQNHLSNSALQTLSKLSKLVAENETTLDAFVRDDHRGQRIPAFLVKVTDALTQEKDSVREELQSLIDNVDHLKQIISLQQGMARSGGLLQDLDALQVVREAINACKDDACAIPVRIREDQCLSGSEFRADKHRLLQILINLVKNARDALSEHKNASPQIEVGFKQDPKSISFTVQDNGIGISPENLERIFQHGFTTKDTGHGFGLHSSANAAVELGGCLSASSDGLGLGACFTLQLPTNK